MFIGFACHNKLEAAMKSCIKNNSKEAVGVVVKRNGKYDIIEYSELTKEDAEAVNEKTGELKYNLGNILVFLLKTDKLIDLCENNDQLNKLYHKAFKKVPYYD